MLQRRSVFLNLMALGAFLGCASCDDSVPVADIAPADAAVTIDSPAVVDAGSDASSETSIAQDGAVPDGATADTSDGGTDSASDAAVDAPGADALTEAGPGGDGGLILGGDGAAADASFQLKVPMSTNLLSGSDVKTTCNTVGSVASTLTLTCTESNGAGGPCRTLTVLFNGTPSDGKAYAAVAKDSPAAGEAVVRYQESIDCTMATTNGWTETVAGGELTIDSYGDTGFLFTLHDAPLAPAPSSAGITNQNAMGTFTLAGTGFSSFLQ
jgi:hypothetical protein